MDFSFTYESQVMDETLEVNIKCLITQEKNYADVQVASFDDWKVESLMTVHGRDLEFMLQGTNDLTREVTHEILGQDKNIIDQYWSEKEEQNAI